MDFIKKSFKYSYRYVFQGCLNSPVICSEISVKFPLEIDTRDFFKNVSRDSDINFPINFNLKPFKDFFLNCSIDQKFVKFITQNLSIFNPPWQTFCMRPLKLVHYTA